MSEVLIDIVDNKTGEIYKEGMLLAVAHLWCVEFGWKVVNEEFTAAGEWDGGVPSAAIRWLYIEAKPDGGRFPERTPEYWKQTRNLITA